MLAHLHSMTDGSVPLRLKKEAFCLYRSRHGGCLNVSDAYVSAGYAAPSRIAVSSNAGTLMLDDSVKQRIEWLDANPDHTKALFAELVKKQREAQRVLKADAVAMITKQRAANARSAALAPVTPAPDSTDHQTLETLLQVIIDDAAAIVERAQRTLSDPALVRSGLDLHRSAVAAFEAHLEGIRQADQYAAQNTPTDGLTAHAMLNQMRRFLDQAEQDAPDLTLPDAPSTLKEVDRAERQLRQNLKWNLVEYDRHVTGQNEPRESLRLLDTMLRTITKIGKLVAQRSNLQVAVAPRPEQSGFDPDLIFEAVALGWHLAGLDDAPAH